MTGRIDVHSHLLPDVDDGCGTLEESIACARILVENGYAQAFCTPHIWPQLPHNRAAFIRTAVSGFQRALDEAGVSLRVWPGGEINIQMMWPALKAWRVEDIPTYGMRGRHCIMDFWSDELPEGFDAAIDHLQSLGLTVILAHPERIGVFQRRPELLDGLVRRGVLLQGNLQCFGEPPETAAHVLVERFLVEGRYFLLGSDTHNLQTLPLRMRGLRRAIELVGEEAVNRLTVTNPRELLPAEAD